MDNFQRGDRALEALAVYRDEPLENTLEVVLPTPDGGEVRSPELDGYVISDLIADLLHVAARFGINPMDKIDQGIQHFGADCIEQAWEADAENENAEWSDMLQAKSNIEHAAKILAINGVPEEYYNDIFVKVGILAPDEREED